MKINGMHKRVGLVAVAILFCMAGSAVWLEIQSDSFEDSSRAQSIAPDKVIGLQPVNAAHEQPALKKNRRIVSPVAGDKTALEEALSQMLALCFEGKITEAEMMYRRLQPRRKELSDVLPAYSEKASSWPASGADQLANKVAGLSFLAGLDPEASFCGWLAKLRAGWSLPLTDSRHRAWKAVEGRAASALAAEALEPLSEDMICSGVLAFLVGEALSDESPACFQCMQRSLMECTPDAKTPKTTELNDPWVSFVISYCSSRLVQASTVAQQLFVSWMRFIAFESAASRRLRQQANFFAQEAATGVFELLDQLGQALSRKDASASLAKYLTTHTLTALECELLIKALIKQYTIHQVSQAFGDAFETIRDIDSDARLQPMTQALVGVLLGDNDDPALAFCAVGVLRSLDVRASNAYLSRNRDNGGERARRDSVFKLLGKEGLPAYRRVLKKRVRVRDESSAAVANVYDINAICMAFGLDEPLEVRIGLVDDMLTSKGQIDYVACSTVLRILARMRAGELIESRVAVIALAERCCSVCYFAKPERDGSQADSAASCVRDLSQLLRILGYPSMSDEARKSLGEMVQVCRTFAASDNGYAMSNDFKRKMESVESEISVLSSQGYLD